MASKPKAKPEDESKLSPDEEEADYKIDDELDPSGETAWAFNNELNDEPEEELSDEEIEKGCEGLVKMILEEHPEWLEEGWDPDAKKEEVADDGEGEDQSPAGDDLGDEEIQKIADSLDRLEQRQKS